MYLFYWHSFTSVSRSLNAPAVETKNAPGFRDKSPSVMETYININLVLGCSSASISDRRCKIVWPELQLQSFKSEYLPIPPHGAPNYLLWITAAARLIMKVKTINLCFEMYFGNIILTVWRRVLIPGYRSFNFSGAAEILSVCNTKCCLYKIHTVHSIYVFSGKINMMYNHHEFFMLLLNAFDVQKY